jgi:hypothetical protein
MTAGAFGAGRLPSGYFLRVPPRVAPARLATALPAPFAALPAAFAADVTPRTADVPAPFAALPAWPALEAAPRAWRVDADFLPAVCERVF